MTKTKRKRWGKKRTFVRNWKQYNEERPHMSLLYKTPKQVWNEAKEEVVS